MLTPLEAGSIHARPCSTQMVWIIAIPTNTPDPALDRKEGRYLELVKVSGPQGPQAPKSNPDPDTPWGPGPYRDLARSFWS